jgi:DNA-binding beta-propeller fold protein YncE
MHWPLKFCAWSFSGSWTLTLGAFLALGCHSSKPPPQTIAAPIVWPSPPETARIAYVQTVRRPSDLGVRVSALIRFGHWITGSEKGNEPLSKPFGIALDEEGNLCLTDTGANAVCFYEQSKRKWHRWDKIGKTRFVSPVAIARRNGLFYVADSSLGSVLVFDEDGKARPQITNHLARPAGLAILGNELFVADSQRHVVAVFDLGGRFQREFGRRGTGPGEFNFPTHVAADSAGRLYVTDSLNGRVQILDASGHFQGGLGHLGDQSGQFGRPKGLAVDSLGHVYALDALFDNLQIFDPTGKLLLTLGQTGADPGQFWLPNGIAINSRNEIFVADCYNHRIQIFKYVGPI